MSTNRDLRNLQSPVKDQGRRGTCVACAATAGHEMLRAEGLDLCVEFLHWASKRRDRLPGMSEGTTLPAVAEALAQIGQPPESAWPYDDQRDQSAPDYLPPAEACNAAPDRRVSSGAAIPPTSAALRDALQRGGAVLLGIRLHMPWYEVGPNGRIAMPMAGARDFGGHAVLVIGHQNATVFVRNSWGADWGANGYAYLPEAYVDAFSLVAWTVSL